MEGHEFELSEHADLRSAQRNLSSNEIEFILAQGNRVRRTGVIFCQLRKIDLPDNLPGNSRMRRLVGSTVVLSSCGQIVLTVYRNARAFHKDTRKAKFRKITYQDYGYA